MIAPWQMADSGLLRPDCPRADLNVACPELLIGLLFLADPPADIAAARGPGPAGLAILRYPLAEKPGNDGLRVR